ncbi:MAG: DUF305 domain-containing protein [Rhodocyclaceae bacterium]|nr:DUF305 domain-containing protein [Rhodocyclaceae bacterium]
MKTSLLVAAMLGCTLSLPVLSAQETDLPAKPAMSMDMDKKMPQMQENMKKMQQQMDQLRVTDDPAERERLMQQHMQTMQDNMMTMHGMRGMGGMKMQGSTGRGGMQPGVTGSDAMKNSMMTGMDSMQSMPMSGETDKDFAMMMKVHHQQAVDMAQVVLDQGKSPTMKAMARKIISAQKKEIAQFDQWLSKQK